MSQTVPSVLILGKVWPEPNSSAAGARMMELINVMRDADWKITFATTASESTHAADLGKYRISSNTIKLNDSSFDDFVADLIPDIVIFDRFMTEEQFGWRVADQCPDALRILDTEDLHCLREARHKSWKEGEQVDVRDVDVAKREIASILRCDLSLIISSYEMKLLKEIYRMDEALLLYLPFMLEPIEVHFINNWLPFHKRKHFISIGNFLHEPNWNAVLYLKEEIWPLIRKNLPKAELYVYGAYASQKVDQLHNQEEGFLVKGRANDAKKVVGNARVLLAPLRFGAGLKGKLIEAMQCGTPSVTTEIGAEAMHGNLPWPGFIENDAKEFSNRAVELYQDEKQWENAQKNGIKIVNQLYQEREYGVRLIQRIGEIRDNLKAHRRQNFMGEILHHHTAASTKYMSKWIEAKNRITD